MHARLAPVAQGRQGESASAKEDAMAGRIAGSGELELFEKMTERMGCSFVEDEAFLAWQQAFAPCEVIWRLRDRFLMSQEEVAYFVCLHPTTISRIERGKRPNASREEILELLSVPDFRLTAYHKSIVLMRFGFAPIYPGKWQLSGDAA